MEEVWRGPRQSRGAGDTSTTSKVIAAAASAAAASAANIAAAEAFAAADFSDGNLGPDTNPLGPNLARTGSPGHETGRDRHI